MPFFGVPIRNGLPIGLGSVAGFGVQQFDPSLLFEGGTVPGAWYDPSDLSTMFTTSAGTTPVAMPGQGSAVSVGLMLDKSQGLVLGPEEDPGFANYTNILTGTWLASGANYVFTDTVGGQSRPGVQWPAFTLAAGWYKITVVVASITGATQIRMDNVGATDQFLVAGTNTFFANVTTLSRPRFRLEDTSTTIGDGFALTYVSVRELPGNHAIAINNTTARPELRARVNLLTYSEEFSNAAWTNAGGRATISANTSDTTDPLGGNTADKFTLTLLPVLPNITLVYQEPAVTNVNVTLSVYAKYGSSQWIALRLGNNYVWFDLLNGIKGTEQSGFVGTITPVVNSWYRITMTGISASNFVGVVMAVDADNSLASTTLGRFTYFWGADLRPANIGANVPAYQRIADADTYDTNGFPLYLFFNGLDDGMYTPANLNLSATDKVGVFAGVRKLSDANIGVPAELSSNASTNNGSFVLYSAVSSAANYGFGLRSTVWGFGTATTFAAPITNVIDGLFDIAGANDSDEVKGRVDGQGQTLSFAGSFGGTGNFGTYPLFIGSRNNNSLWFNGHLYSLAVVGSAVSAGNIAAMENWVAGKTGIVI